MMSLADVFRFRVHVCRFHYCLRWPVALSMLGDPVFFWQNVLSATDYLSMGCMTDGLSWFGNSFLKNVAPAARQLAGLGFLNEAFFDQ